MMHTVAQDLHLPEMMHTAAQDLHLPEINQPPAVASPPPPPVVASPDVGLGPQEQDLPVQQHVDSPTTVNEDDDMMISIVKSLNDVRINIC
jgi:hypothetical protein